MKRASGTSHIVRFLSRVLFAVVCVVVLTLVSIQFARIVGENVAMAHSLSSIRQDVKALKAHKRQDEREVRRLLDPSGAIPDIHSRLHLVGPNEAIIYVKPAPTLHP